MTNPLLEDTMLPGFSRIEAHHVEPAIDSVLAGNRQRIADLLESGADTFETLVAPLEILEHRLGKIWSPVSHLNGVRNDEAMRAAYNACLPKLSDYQTELGQNTQLYKALERIAEREGDNLDQAQRRLLELALRDFRLAGVALDAGRKARFRTLMNELSKLQSGFEENLLDATNAWHRHIEDEARLAGVPAHALARAREEAQRRKLDGWVFTLDYPAYHAVISHAHDAALRREFYTAWVTRASDEGPHAGRWDNATLIEDILARRHEAACLLGFANFAEYSLASKMADSPDEVLGFLEDLAQRTRPVGAREFKELEKFAGASLAAWDVPYHAERLRRERYQISDEELRPYFPVDRVLGGMFEVVQKLFDIHIALRDDVDVWHADAQYYDVRDGDGTLRGGFYIDLYARPAKRGGAWMDECVGRVRLAREQVDPVAYLSCNFSPAVGGEPARLTHDEVVTLFHEFGHVLHHLLTRVDYPSVAGINGVAWDAVELPSQFMENFAWSTEVLPLISGHYQTGDPLPEELFRRLLGTRTFHGGLQMLRQLEFALFDLQMHRDYDPARGARLTESLAAVRAQVAVIPVPDFNRFPNSFAHVFGGGYAAGYYSYKWAEVLSSDAFAVFEESPRDILDARAGQRFARAVLERGGAVDAMTAFVDFRGRRPEIDALLRHSGITGGGGDSAVRALAE